MPDSVWPIGTLNPFDKTEAETICYEEGVKTGWYNGTPITGGENLYVYNMHDEDYILVRNADFGNEGAGVNQDELLRQNKEIQHRLTGTMSAKMDKLSAKADKSTRKN